jgi:hypothetical protein
LAFVETITIVSSVHDHYLQGYYLFHKKLLLCSVLNSFGVETIFDHTGEEMSLYPGAIFDGQQQFGSLGIVR